VNAPVFSRSMDDLREKTGAFTEKSFLLLQSSGGLMSAPEKDPTKR